MDVLREKVVDISHHRTRKRIKDLGEVFTPEKYVHQMLDMLDKSVWSDENIIFFEPTCGHGNFVSAIVQRRLEGFLKKAKRAKVSSPHYYAIANTLNNLWAIDVDRKNINHCRSRVWDTILKFYFSNEKSNSIVRWKQKDKEFWAHVLCCIKRQIHENEMLSSLEKDFFSAEKSSLQTAISKKWFSKNGYKPIDFQLSWVELYRNLERSGAVQMEFKRAVKFIDSAKYGVRKGSFKDFDFANLNSFQLEEAQFLEEAA